MHQKEPFCLHVFNKYHCMKKQMLDNRIFSNLNQLALFATQILITSKTLLHRRQFILYTSYKADCVQVAHQKH